MYIVWKSEIYIFIFILALILTKLQTTKVLQPLITLQY